MQPEPEPEPLAQHFEPEPEPELAYDEVIGIVDVEEADADLEWGRWSRGRRRRSSSSSVRAFGVLVDADMIMNTRDMRLRSAHNSALAEAHLRQHWFLSRTTII